MRNHWIRWSLLLSSLLWPTFICAEQLPIRAWTTAEGLPHNHINRIRRDTRGFMWFCTNEGLARFDGATFVSFSTREGLPHPVINDVLEAQDGSFWVATEGGIGHIQTPSRCCSYTTGAAEQEPQQRGQPRNYAHLPIKVYRLGTTPFTNWVRRLFQDRQGRIYAGTADGMFRLTAGEAAFQRIDRDKSPDDLEVVYDFAEDRAGVLWIATWKGLSRLTTHDQLVHFSVQQGQEYDQVRALLMDRHGMLWIGHDGAGLIVLDPRRLDIPNQPSPTHRIPLAAIKEGVHRWFTTRDKLPEATIWSLHEARNGVLWIGSRNYITSFDGAQFRPIENKNSKLGSVAVRTIAEDTAGNIWAGGETGVSQVIRTGFVSWAVADGLSTNVPTAIFEGKDGKLYVITNDWALNWLEGEVFHSVPLPRSRKGLNWESRLRPLQSQQREWWVPTRDGILRFPATADPNQLARLRPKAIYDARHGIAPDTIHQMYEDSSGNIWITTDSNTTSVWRWDPHTDRFQSYPSGLSPGVYCEDRSGTVWMGLFGGGLLRHRAGDLKLFTAASDRVPEGSIQSLHLDQKGQLWLGTSSNGLACLSQPAAETLAFRRYTVREGLSSDNVVAVTDDGNGQIYVANGRGLDRLDTANGEISHVLSPSDLNFSEVRLLHSDRHKNLWLGGPGGLFRLSLEEKRPRPAPPLITGLVVSNRALSLPTNGIAQVEGLELPIASNRLQIDFSSSYFYYGERPLYQYKLMNSDADWSAPSKDNRVTYANLAPGDYRFLVRTLDVTHQFSHEFASVSFTIPNPIYLRGWFLALSVVLLGGMVYAAYRYRVARIVEMERIRLRIASDLHDDVGANLSLIAGLSEMLAQQAEQTAPQLRPQLSTVADVSRRSMDAMSDIVWMINPNKDHLRDLTQRIRRFANDTLAPRNIVVSFALPDGEFDMPITSESRREIFLICKEAVNNIARHAACTAAEITLTLDGTLMTLRVRDNGKGFVPTATNGNGNGGQGLLSMRSRAEKLGGQLTITTPPDGGTEIVLRAHIGA